VFAHSEESTYRWHRLWLFAFAGHKKVINLADRFVCVVEYVAADHFGRPVCTSTLAIGTVCLTPCAFKGAARKTTPIIAALASNIVIFMTILTLAPLDAVQILPGNTGITGQRL
jgi:hypothetical protein